MQAHGVNLAFCDGNGSGLGVDKVPSEQAWLCAACLLHVLLLGHVAQLVVNQNRVPHVWENRIGLSITDLFRDFEVGNGLVGQPA